VGQIACGNVRRSLSHHKQEEEDLTQKFRTLLHAKAEHQNNERKFSLKNLFYYERTAVRAKRNTNKTSQRGTPFIREDYYAQ